MRRHPFLWLLRRLGAGRRTAKAAFYCGSWLIRIKILRRTYQFNGWDKPFTFAGWQWRPCNPSMRLVGLSMQLDWDHWDHWACLHEHCAGEPCAECGGVDCPHDDDLDEEVTA